MQVVDTQNASYQRPQRKLRGSKYDEILTAAMDLSPGQGVAETYETTEEAKKALMGVRQRRMVRGLKKNVFPYLSQDGLSVVIIPREQKEEKEDA